MEISIERNKIKSSNELLLEIARTQVELEYSKHHVSQYSRGFIDNLITQSFDIVSIAEVGFKVFSKLFSKGSGLFRKKKQKESD